MATAQKIPYFDLTRQYSKYRSEWLEQIDRLGQSGNFILGDAVSELELGLSQFLDVKHAITVASGTDAITLALRTAGVGYGDVVVVPNFTFYASVEAISLTGAKPRLVDICLTDFNVDCEKMSAALDENVKAVLPVHLFGLPANMAKICAICRERGIAVIEDVAQAFGSQYDGKFSGTIGEMGCFSFYPTKVLGAYGDGGMVTTNDDAYAENLKLLRNHGVTGPNQHELIGYTSRLNCVQAVLLKLKLQSVQEAIERRQQLADRYKDQLLECEVELPASLPGKRHVYNVFTVRTAHRDKLADALKSNQVGYQVYYPMPIHKQIPYQDLGYTDESFPASIKACNEVISLPLYPEMPDDHVDRICEIIRSTIA